MKDTLYSMVKRGEIYFANIGGGVGSEQQGERPVLILQNDIGNKFSPTTIVASITSIDKKSTLPVHYVLDKNISNLPNESTILLEQIRTIDKSRLLSKVSILPESTMNKINEILMVSLALSI